MGLINILIIYTKIRKIFVAKSKKKKNKMVSKVKQNNNKKVQMNKPKGPGAAGQVQKKQAPAAPPAKQAPPQKNAAQQKNNKQGNGVAKKRSATGEKSCACSSRRRQK